MKKIREILVIIYYLIISSDNKPIAIVTGASAGLGKHISLKLSQNHFHVMLIARNKKILLKIKDQIELEGNECTVISADISKPNSIKKISSKLKKDDSVEVLVNNAGDSFQHWSKI